MTNDEIPPIEYEPPYSEDFIAHLHAGYYDDEPDFTKILLAALKDEGATELIFRLDEVRRILRR